MTDLIRVLVRLNYGSANGVNSNGSDTNGGAPGGGPGGIFVPSLKFNDRRNSQYVPLLGL